MIDPCADVPGAAGFELLIVIGSILYTGYKFIIALLGLNFSALKFYIPSVLILIWMVYMGPDLNLFAIPCVCALIYLCAKGNSVD